MKKAIIIEDESLTAERLEGLLGSYPEEVEVLAVLASVKHAKAWLQEEPHPDVIFMDIELSDGTAFDILEACQIDTQIIFTTAYDQYALRAFKYNSVDYLLKPIDREELYTALDRIAAQPATESKSDLYEELRMFIQKPYKKRFLVKKGDYFVPIETREVAYFYSEEGYTFLRQQDGKRHIIDFTLDDLNEVLDPSDFFRLNRKVISRAESIGRVASYFNGRLTVELVPAFDESLVISRERVKPFKMWLDT